MANLHVITGYKGGVGKSLVTCVLLEFLLAKNIAFKLFETDRDNPDVKRRYGDTVNCDIGLFSEARRHQDAANNIFTSATEILTIVNSPAQLFAPFAHWFEANDLFTLGAEEGVSYYFWFVCDGGFDSIDLLKKTFQFFTDNVHYVVVKNHGLCEDWKLFESDTALQKQLKKYKVIIVDFPLLLGRTLPHEINTLSLMFSQAIAHPGFDKINQQRVKTFLRKAFQAFEATGVFTHEQQQLSAQQ
ncbi:MAG: hypothetical protein KME46_21790 [Brasilonema angustatum HA4187-MV1]|jgi:hypothetical protein|nr:hypothetical protein [Brasilonema angustatum HA4187-MV1]